MRFGDTYPHYAYTDSEIVAVETISEVYSPKETADIDSTHPYHSLFGRSGDYTGRTVELGTTGPATVHLAGEPPQSVRSQTIDTSRNCSAARNHVYANGDVTMCPPPSITGGST